MSKKISLLTALIVITLYNSVNYFIVTDNALQWLLTMSSISFVQLILVLVFLIDDIKKVKLKKESNIILSFWLFLYFLIDFVGTLLGYNLHSRGFSLIVFLTLGIAFVNYAGKEWLHKRY